MAEAGEAPVELKVRERERLQGLSQNVVLEGRRQRAPVLDAVDQRRLEGAQRLARVGKWNEALQDLQGNGREIAGNLRTLVNKFGINFNAATDRKNLTPAEQGRVNRANNALGALVPILETEGFDQMTNAQQTALRTNVRAALILNARLPDFARMRPNQQNEVVDRFLRDPKLKQELFDILKEIQGMPLTTASDAISSEKKTEVNRVTREDAGDKVGFSRTDVTRARDRLNDIINNPATADLGVRARLLLDQIDQNRVEIGALDTALPELEAALTGILPVMAAPALATGGGRVPMIQNPAYERAQARIRANEDRRAQLNQEISDLIRDRIGSVPNEETLNENRNTKFDEFGRARIGEVEARFNQRESRVEYQELAEERGLQEENITRRLEEAFQRSLAQYVNNELQQSMEHFEANEGEIQGETMKAVKREIARHFQARWTMQANRNRGIFRRRRNEPAINEASVNRDFDRLMQAGANNGIEPLMRDALRRLRPVGPGNVRAAMSADEINTLMNNDTFAEEFRGEMLKNIIARRAIIRPFRPGELYQMTNMQPVREAIKGAMETNGDFRSFVKETVGDEDAEENPQAFWSRFSREAWEQPGLFLFPVTTIPWSIWAGLRAAWRGRQNTRSQQALELVA